MKQKHSMCQTSTLEAVKQQFNTWRKNKTCKRTPKKLWQAAVDLHKVEGLSIHRISKALHLNYNDFKKQIADNNVPVIKNDQSLAFIELDYAQPAFISECIVEMENTTGSKMRMSFKGNTDFDLLAFGKSFWRQSS